MKYTCFDPHEICRQREINALRHHEKCMTVDKVYQVDRNGVKILKTITHVHVGPQGLVIEIGE
jgi:hypothetical protein